MTAVEWSNGEIGTGEGDKVWVVLESCSQMSSTIARSTLAGVQTEELSKTRVL